MPKCPDCETDNDFVYVGLISAECPNKQCRNYDVKAYAAWVKATTVHPNDKQSDPDKTPTEDQLADAESMAEMYQQLGLMYGYGGNSDPGDDFD